MYSSPNQRSGLRHYHSLVFFLLLCSLNRLSSSRLKYTGVRHDAIYLALAPLPCIVRASKFGKCVLLASTR